MVFPVAVGGGERLSEHAGAPASLRLVEAKPAGDTLLLTYRPA
jgi:hypothetical protein